MIDVSEGHDLRTYFSMVDKYISPVGEFIRQIRFDIITDISNLKSTLRYIS